ncbi:MAG: cell division protein FtsZ [Flavobacteriaceae bacterium]|nr:cell division protein FtsZ [Flavobacteriaceae bacterium]
MHNQSDTMDQEGTKGINFDLPKNRSNVIKVLGVGGGGSNAINYMFQQGIKGVDFIVSNTDAQALTESGVPTKIQLGASLTEGLGAGANPEVGERAAVESKDEIQSILSTQTKMIFITAGMGGGTGTGAAPVIAKMAKSLDILTVGIVTMPFQFEGKLRLEQAQKGLEKIKASVDALIVINNNKLREVYGNLGFKAGFAKADEVLATAARGIAEVITHHYTQNIDLKDAKTVLTNSGTAIMGSGSASGSNRAQEAIVKALDSPLLNDNKITGCKNVLLLIVSGTDEITIDEIGEINDFIQTEAGNHTNIIMGVGEDETLGNEVSVTVIATGFGQEQQNEISNTEAKKIIHTLEDEQKMEHDLSEKSDTETVINSFEVDGEFEQKRSIPNLKSNPSQEQDPLIDLNAILYDIEVDSEIVPNGLSEKQIHMLIEEEEEAPMLFTTPESDISVINDESVEVDSEIKSPDEDVVVPEMESIEEKLEITTSESPLEILENDPTEEETEINPVALSFETQDDGDEINNVSTFFEPQFEAVSEVSDSEDPNKMEVTASENAIEEEFMINEVSSLLSEIDVVDPEIVAHKSQFQMDFELPFVQETDQKSIVFQSEENKVEDSASNLQQELEEASLEVKFEIKDESIELKEEKDVIKEETAAVGAATNPFEQSIDQTIIEQSEKRKEHLKAFNHKFKHQLQRVDDMEKEPAYKRQGLDIDAEAPSAPSRVSLDNNGDDDLQLRSNNSFLHDNVD